MKTEREGGGDCYVLDVEESLSLNEVYYNTLSVFQLLNHSECHQHTVD